MNNPIEFCKTKRKRRETDDKQFFYFITNYKEILSFFIFLSADTDKNGLSLQRGECYIGEVIGIARV
jgi:hypothetical protein